jgi:hypothetical protein
MHGDGGDSSMTPRADSFMTRGAELNGHFDTLTVLDAEVEADEVEALQLFSQNMSKKPLSGQKKHLHGLDCSLTFTSSGDFHETPCTHTQSEPHTPSFLHFCTSLTLQKCSHSLTGKQRSEIYQKITVVQERLNAEIEEVEQRTSFCFCLFHRANCMKNDQFPDIFTGFFLRYFFVLRYIANF